jgi:hypothetical protein
MSLTVYKINRSFADQTFGIAGKKAKIFAEFEDKLIVVKDATTFQELLDSESQNILWWRNFYRVLFGVVVGALLVLNRWSSSKKTKKN